MAIRPSWDKPLVVGDRRIEAVQVRADLARQKQWQQQARADAVRSDTARADASRAIEHEIDTKIGRYWDGEQLTGAGVDYLLKHQAMPPANARADSVARDGLICTTTYDASNRPIHEFKSIDGKKHWMNDFRSPALLMTAITNNVENTRKQGQRYLAEHPEAIPV